MSTSSYTDTYTKPKGLDCLRSLPDTLVFIFTRGALHLISFLTRKRVLARSPYPLPSWDTEVDKKYFVYEYPRCLCPIRSRFVNIGR